MDIPNTVMPPLHPRYARKSEENRRDTIMIRERPMTAAERKKWCGDPPRPIPETDRYFRPAEVKF